MDTINSTPKGIKYPMPSLQLWLRHESNASHSKSCYALKFSPAKAEDWELHEYHRVATNHPKPLFHSKQPYSLSNSQPRFPIPYRIPKDRKARANAKSPKPALRLHWVEWRHKTEALAHISNRPWPLECKNAKKCIFWKVFCKKCIFWNVPVPIWIFHALIDANVHNLTKGLGLKMLF